MDLRRAVAPDRSTGAAAEAPPARPWGPTAATVLTSLLVAALASRPNSPLTPPLFEGSEAPGFLRAAADALGLSALPRDVAAAVSAAFLLAAAGAFLYALLEAWRGRLPLRWVLVVGLGLHVLALLTPLFLSRDVYSYAIYGRMVSVHGVNPYVDIPAGFAGDPVYPLVSVDWIDSPSVYGPAFSAIAAGVTAVVESPPAIVLAFKALAVAASAATMLLVAAAARSIRPERAAFAAALVGWNPVVIFHGAAGGHNDTLVGLAIAASVLLVLRGRDLWATAILAVGTLVKVSAGVPLAVVVVVSVLREPPGRRFRRFALHAAVGLAVGLPFIVPFMQAHDPTLGALELSSRLGWLAPSRLVLVPLRGAARALGGDVAGDVVSAIVRVAFPAVFVAVLVGLRRHLARGPRRIEPLLVVATMGWATLVAVLISPLLYPWYMAWLVPVVWMLPRPGRAAAIVLSVALAVTELVAEPSRSPRVWEAMVFGLHYIVTPVILVVLIRLLLDLRRRVALPGGEGWEDPLLIERSPSAQPRAGRRAERAAAT
ncbi:MAG TPA: hypothetical protein VHL78_09290 [Actinomycetota bacterium]|nr:hypothetical protein [Actinomycetota bacterium]